MEGAENLLPLNDNEINNINESNQDILNENITLESEDYQVIITNSFPCSLCSIIISIIIFIPKHILFSNTKKDEDLSQANHIFSYLKIMLIIYLLYTCKAIFYYYMKKKINLFNNDLYQSIISILYIILDISYYLSTIAGYYSYQRLSLDFIITNLYKCIFIFSIIFVGIVHICLFFLNLILMIIIFIFSLNSFFDNASSFITNQSQFPWVLDGYLHVEKADSEHCTDCYICLSEIEKGQEIIILKCSNLHYFHSKCIKQWLRQSYSCPLCRRHNIL